MSSPKHFDPTQCSYDFLLILAYVLDQMDTMAGVLDTEGKLLYANKAALEGVGATLDQIVGVKFSRSPWRNHSTEATKITDGMIEKALVGRASLIEDSVVNRYGEPIPMLFSISPVHDVQGNVIALIPEGKIIAEQKKLQSKIRKEQWETQQWIDSMGTYVAKCDKEGRVISCNKPFLNAMGISREEIRGKYICDTTYLGHSSKTQKKLQKAIKDAGNGKNVSLEVPLSIGGEGLKASLFSVSPILDSAGEIAFVALEIIDISEQVRLRELMIEREKQYSNRLKIEVNKIAKALRETELFNKNLVNAAPVGLIYLDENDRLLFTNPNMEQKLLKSGFSKNSIKGKKLYELGIYLADSAWKKIENPAKNRIGLGKMKVLFSRKGTDELQFEVSAASLRGSSEGKEGTILIMDDVTEKNRLEEEIIRAQIQSEKMSSLKLLISGVAHELNNPLTSIIGCAEHLVEDNTLSEESAEAARIIINDAKRAGKIVKNLFDFTAKEAMKGVAVNLNDVVKNVVDIRRHEIKKRGIEIVLDLDPRIRSVEAGETEMQQVILNLLRNAVNVIEEWGVGSRIAIRTFEENDEVVMEIEDDGPGIGEDYISKIFDPFFTTRHYQKGTGLGLSIVYGIIQKYGGSIAVDTSYSQGAKFVIRFPYAKII